MYASIEIDVILLCIVTMALFVVMGAALFFKNNSFTPRDKLGVQALGAVFMFCGAFNLYVLLFRLNPPAEEMLRERLAELFSAVIG